MIAKTAPQRKFDSAIDLTATRRRLRVSVANLELGLFVAELDRPWVDTPFLMQGFLLDNDADLETLRKYCRYVYIDLKFSDEAVAAEWRAAGLGQADEEATSQAAYEDERVVRDAAKLSTSSAATPMQSGFAPAGGDDQDEASATILVGPTPIEPQRASRKRSAQASKDPPVSAETRQRFLEFVRAIASDERQNGRAFLDRVSHWLNTPLFGGKAAPDRQASTQVSGDLDLSGILPQGVSLTIYQDTAPAETELPRARQAFTYGEKITRDIATAIRAGALPDIPEVKDCVNHIVDSMIANPDAVMFIARLRDEDINTYHHGVKVSLYLIALGRHLGIPKAQLIDLGLIGMLADVGKIKLPRALLDKPGPLSPAEFDLVKGHVALGLGSLEGSTGLPSAVLQGIAQHHERLDGSGYPGGLTSDQIGVYGRMSAIADSFSAMTTPQSYANASSAQEALLSLYEAGGTSFSAPLIEQFVQAVGVFPVGSLVELSNGEVAVVVAHNRVRRLEPRVLVLTAPDKSPLATPIERDLFQMAKSSSTRLRITKGLRTNSFSLTIRDHYQLVSSAADSNTV
jgi:HD-GYP domain-containing protein (c-di-GMP phosphodiesterase class II)